MDSTAAILCAVILCLIAYIVWTRYDVTALAKSAIDTATPAAEPMHSGEHDGRHAPRCPCRKCASPEQRAMSENLEHFSSCAAEKCDTGTVVGTANEFGGTGGDFRDWAMSQAVDAQVLVNHREFVKDRFGNNNQNITGRTFAMGEVEGTDQVPWQGILGRPQAVESCNPTQQPDVDMRNFTTSQRFRWKSV